MFGRLPMYQQKGKSALNAKLDNILRFAEHLENPQDEFKTIHVAGTNGKGSSSHMLASVLQEAGYTVGLYTSPHLKDFRERMRINGKTVEKRFVIDFIADNKAFLEKNNLSFFEMTVGMAFSYFAEVEVDIAIIEVGLGGRLDSTNIITPEVSLITNIGLDHTDILGDSLAKIALEKGGIIKQGVPAIISESQRETKGVFKKIAVTRRAPMLFADDVITELYETDLLGNYQTKNMKGVLVVLATLNNFKIANKAKIEGLKNVVRNTGLVGRWQIIGKNPKIICDTAHNAEGLELVVRQLLTEKYANLHIVFGLVKGKDFDSILNLLPTFATYYFCAANNNRSYGTWLLKDKALRLGRKGKSYTTVKGALKAAKRAAKKDDLIYVGGSNFVVAEVL